MPDFTTPVCFDESPLNPVTCGIDQIDQVNNALQRLESNILFLKQSFDVVQLDRALFICDAVVLAGVQIGQPVYYNGAAGRWDLSQIATVTSGENTILSQTSEVWGLVIGKSSATVATVLLDGVASVDLTVSTGFKSPLGTFYLSATLGTLSAIPGVVKVPVLVAAGDGQVLFRPWFAESYDHLRSIRLPLSVAPAGDASLANGQWSITNPVTTVPGWLPANHASFSGNAPAGAKFGYSLAADVSVQENWPLYPLTDVDVVWDRGGVASGGQFLQLGPQGMVQLNQHGIWWLSNCEYQVPWVSLMSPYSSACPRTTEPTLEIRGTRLFGASAADQVTRLRRQRKGLRVFRRGGQLAAEAGDLDVQLYLGELLPESVDNSVLGRTVTGYDAGEDRLLQSRAVNSVRSTSPIVNVTGTTQDAVGAAAGNVVISSGSGYLGMIPHPVRVALEGATEEPFGDNLAIGFPADRDAAVLSQFVMFDLGATLSTRLDLWFLLTQTGTVPPLAVSAKILPGLAVNAVATPGTLTTVPLTLPQTAVTAGSYIRVQTDAFSVPSDSLVLIRLLRSAQQGDGYPGEVHLIRQRLIVLAGG